MLTSTFFGHRDEDYFPYGEKIEAIVKSLIEDCGCIQFYSGYRGEFEKYSAYIVFRLKERYPYIRNTMILSYPRQIHAAFPALFDEAVYLLEERKVFPQYAIPRTNQKLVDLSNCIVSGGGNHNSGEAFTACNYARKKGKLIISIYE